MTRSPVSGAQLVLRSGDYEAVIATVGATLRSLKFGSLDLVAPFDANEMRPAMSGALLAPWPNRTADGAYEFDGERHELAVSEHATRTAAHGLVVWQRFAPVSVETDRVTLAATIEAQPGYPWQVALQVTFTLTADGLTQEVVATNESDRPAPFGMGGHPYLVAGEPRRGAIDAWRLEVPASQVLAVDPDRLLPAGISSVAAHEFGALDFRRARVLGPTVVNEAFTELHRDEHGLTTVTVTGDDGRGARISWDRRCPWVQIYTSDAAPGDRRRHAIAVEPMTCPPDALNSKRDLLVIDPGARVSAGWTIARVEADAPGG